MKNIIIIIASVITLAGCQSKSYYAADSINIQRFNGWEEENAEFLLISNDMTMLLENLSELALNKAEYKDTYITTREALESYRHISNDITIEAATKRVKLANALSGKSDKVYQELARAKDEDFDMIYKKLVLDRIVEFKQLTASYRDEGRNDRIKELSRKIDHKLVLAEEIVSKLDIS
jgi:hypothetical protein